MKIKTIILGLAVILLFNAAGFASNYSVLSGEKVSGSEIGNYDRAVLLFWTTWCPYCRKAVEEFRDKCGELAERGYKTYFVNMKENKSKVSKFAGSMNIKCSVILDSLGRLFFQYRVLGIPTYVFLENGEEIGRSSYLNIKQVEELYGRE